MPEAISSADIRSAYDADYYLHVCGGAGNDGRSESGALSRRLLDALNLAELTGSEDVLDVGCGRGEIVAEAARRGCRAIGVDYSVDAIALAKRHVAGCAWVDLCRFEVGDATQLDLGGRSFDVIFALDVLEHMNSAELRRLLGWIESSLKPGGRLIFHTSPNRHFYSVAYRAVRWLSLVLGSNPLPAEARCEFEQRMHINELTLRELERGMTEAGLECDAKLFGMERVLQTVREAGFGRRIDAFLSSLACRPSLRAFTNSDLIGTAARDRGGIDARLRLPGRGSIPLDHPAFFHEGWYVPVADETSPHRWSSPRFSFRGWSDEVAHIDLLLALQPGPLPRIRVERAPKGFELAVRQEAKSLRLSLCWPPTRHPAVVRLRVPPLQPVAGDPRRFGAYLREAERR